MQINVTGECHAFFLVDPNPLVCFLTPPIFPCLNFKQFLYMQLPLFLILGILTKVEMKEVPRETR